MQRIVGYLPPSIPYRGPATTSTYSAPSASAIPKTQPVYTSAITHDYKSPPGLLRRGYFYARSATGYDKPAAAGAAPVINPAYYYSAGNQAYFGPWYQPPPTVLQPPIYIPSGSLPAAPLPLPTTSSYPPSRPVTVVTSALYVKPALTKPAAPSSYSRRDGSGSDDLDMAASDGGYVNSLLFLSVHSFPCFPWKM